jgi:hypothetical protein
VEVRFSHLFLVKDPIKVRCSQVNWLTTWLCPVLRRKGGNEKVLWQQVGKPSPAACSFRKAESMVGAETNAVALGCKVTFGQADGVAGERYPFVR